VREELYGTANQPVCIGKKDERALAVPGQGRARSQRHRDRHRRAAAAVRHNERDLRARRADEAAQACSARHAGRRQRARPISAPAARTTPRPACRRHRAPMRASAATYMAQWMDRSTVGFTQMGGEGANWVGEAPFSKRGHVFQNLGDGTYNHSGSLALRFAGSRRHQRHLQDPVQRRRRHDRRPAARGRAHRRHDRPPGARRGRRAHRVVTDEPDKYPQADRLAGGIRSITATISTPCSATCRGPGVSVLIYDQTCAAEKRRRRKRGTLSRSRQARDHQRTRLRGLRRLRRAVELRLRAAGRDRIRPQAAASTSPPATRTSPASTASARPSSRCMAASRRRPPGRRARPTRWTACLIRRSAPIDSHLELHRHRRRRHRRRHHRRDPRHGRASRRQGLRHDRHGRASRRRAARSTATSASPNAGDIHAIRVAAGKADLVLGCDLVVTGNKKVLGRARGRDARFVVNTAESCPATSRATPTSRCRPSAQAAIARRRASRAHFFDATRHGHRAVRQFAIGANMFMLGFACQRAAAGLGRGDRKGDRAQRPGGRDEHGRLPLGPPRGPRSRDGPGAGRACWRQRA
jgi:indolepyruvate ferredoxin oxidoreductase